VRHRGDGCGAFKTSGPSGSSTSLLPMSAWEHLPKPEGVGDIRDTDDGFEALVSIPTDDEGYFGRECPACQAPFKMRHDEYEALPEEVELTCPYCGHHEGHSSFMSSAQHARAMAAAKGLTEQWVHEQANDIFGRTFGRRASRPKQSKSFISVEWSYTPGTPPPLRILPAVLEAQTRRIVECSVCGNHHAVYSATSFCPVCGPRPATARVLEAIAQHGRRWPSRTAWTTTSARGCVRRECSSASPPMRSNRP
jgi:DNA-directed RNA polymerase subunit M/transcription elongation factor TFIIS